MTLTRIYEISVVDKTELGLIHPKKAEENDKNPLFPFSICSLRRIFIGLSFIAHEMNVTVE